MNSHIDQRLLDHIYAAAWDPGALHDALRTLADTCRSRSAGLFHLHDGALAWEQSWNMPDGFMTDFVTHAAPHDPRVHFGLSRPPLTLMRDDEPTLRRAMCAAGIEDFTRDYDLPYTVSCVLERSAPDDALALYVSRGNDDGRPDATQVSLFSRYAPHFARAMALRRRIRRDLRDGHVTPPGDLPHATRRTAGPAPPISATPTPRQLQVLSLVAEGLMSKQIGVRLGIAENTVRNHIQHLFRLLDVSTRTACVARARACGLLEP